MCICMHVQCRGMYKHDYVMGERPECSVIVLIFLILTCCVSGVMAVLFLSG